MADRARKFATGSVTPPTGRRRGKTLRFFGLRPPGPSVICLENPRVVVRFRPRHQPSFPKPVIAMGFVASGSDASTRCCSAVPGLGRSGSCGTAWIGGSCAVERVFGRPSCSRNGWASYPFKRNQLCACTVLPARLRLNQRPRMDGSSCQPPVARRQASGEVPDTVNDRTELGLRQNVRKK